MAELTAEQLNKIFDKNREEIQDKYDLLAKLYTTQSAQLETELSRLKKGIAETKTTVTTSEDKTEKSVSTPLNAIARHLKDIKTILAEQFKKTSLGTADTDKGLIKRIGTPLDANNKGGDNQTNINTSNFMDKLAKTFWAG